MKLVLQIAGGIILALVLLTAGCAALIGGAAHEATKAANQSIREINASHRYKVVVSCACRWSGQVGNATYDGGPGIRTIKFRDRLVATAVIQKSGASHNRLEVWLTRGLKTLDHAKTDAAYGSVTVSGS